MTDADTKCDPYAGARDNAQGWYETIKERVAQLNGAVEAEDSGQDYSANAEDDARTAIHESILSVEVRSGWFNPAMPVDGDRGDRKPAEYRILLTTGGPALQLVGKLSEYGEPETAELQMQDWGAQWATYASDNDQGMLLTFARCFYFGE